MNAEEAKTLGNFFTTSVEQEISITKKVIQNVPDDRKGYKPDPKSMTAHELSWHIASTEVWFLESIVKGNFDMPETQAPPPATIREILAFYDASMNGLVPEVKALSGEHLSKVVSFYGMTFPNVVYLSIMQAHSIHHRGQLSTYLRPMGSKVPSIYGGSADEPFQGEASGA